MFPVVLWEGHSLGYMLVSKMKANGNNLDIVPAIQKVFICLVSSLLMNIFSIVLFLTR